MGLTSADGGLPTGDLKTVSEDVERAQPQRVWSVPDFRYKGLGGGAEEFAPVT